MQSSENCSPALQPYIYNPLPPGHIRVLTLVGESPSPGPRSALTWSLQILPILGESLEEVRQYEALSYTWGDLSKTYPLICDGRELRIHHNLHFALPHSARRGSSLPLWIDAVCINQRDDSEKLPQIRMMADIYKRAVRIWVWLGLAKEPGAQEAVEVILPRVPEAAEKLKKMPEIDDTLSPEELDLPPITSPAWDAYYDIIASPWFLRLWIVQEVSIAREVKFLFGKYVLSWPTIWGASDSIGRLRLVQDRNGQRLANFRAGSLAAESYKVLLCKNSYQHQLNSGDNSYETVAEMVGRICFVT